MHTETERVTKRERERGAMICRNGSPSGLCYDLKVRREGVYESHWVNAGGRVVGDDKLIA